MTIEITGSMAGHADRHTESSLAESFENAYFTAPWDIYEGPLKDFPKKKIRLEAEPLVLFAHGSSGIGGPSKPSADGWPPSASGFSARTPSCSRIA